MDTANEKKRLHLRLLTPDRPLLEDTVDMVVLRTVEGDMGILPGHERIAVMLDTGLLRVKRADSTETFLVTGGFARVENDTVSVTAVLAAPPDKMDGLIRELEQQRQTRKSETERWEHEVTRAEMALRRVLVERESGVSSVFIEKSSEPTRPEKSENEGGYNTPPGEADELS